MTWIHQAFYLKLKGVVFFVLVCILFFHSESANPIILANSAHTWFWGRPYFSLSLCFPLLISLWYLHSSKHKIGVFLDWDADCGDVLQLCLEFCRHWAFEEGAVGCILLNTIICWFITCSSLHLNPWEVSLYLDWVWRLCSFKQLRIKGIIQSHWLAMCPRVSLLWSLRWDSAESQLSESQLSTPCPLATLHTPKLRDKLIFFPLLAHQCLSGQYSLWRVFCGVINLVSYHWLCERTRWV